MLGLGANPDAEVKLKSCSASYVDMSVDVFTFVWNSNVPSIIQILSYIRSGYCNTTNHIAGSMRVLIPLVMCGCAPYIRHKLPLTGFIRNPLGFILGFNDFSIKQPIICKKRRSCK
jgi:hypothetical protein